MFINYLGGELIIKFFIIFLIVLNTIIPILFINIFSPVKEEMTSPLLAISLYITETKKVKIIPIEEYIAQVVYAEMPASFELEALKSQAIAARSYTYKKLETKNHEQIDLCTDAGHCQAWRPSDETENYKKVAQAVEETKGRVATYNGEVINAVYHASSGGYTEDAIDVWSGDTDYLISVESPNEDTIMKDYKTKLVLNRKEFFTKLNINNSQKLNIKVLSRTKGDRVKEIKINERYFTGTEIRKIFNLRSSNFEISCTNNDVTFEVKGYGHGVGLSQWGAQAMALEGKNAEEIIKHYYKGVEIENIVNNDHFCLTL